MSFLNYQNDFKNEIKREFSTREGKYQLVNSRKFSVTCQQVENSAINCRLSLTLSSIGDVLSPILCFNIGREVGLFAFAGSDLEQIDKKVYRQLWPSAHCFCPQSSENQSTDCLKVAIGFTTGEVHFTSAKRRSVDHIHEVSTLINDSRTLDNSRVTCIRWVPLTLNEMLVTYSSGQIYLFDVRPYDTPVSPSGSTYGGSGSTLPTSGSTAPGGSSGVSVVKPPVVVPKNLVKQGPGFSIYVASKPTSSPAARWVIGNGAVAHHSSNALSSAFHSSASNHGHSTTDTAVNMIEFSPCTQYMAVCSQDGYMRVFHYHNRELYGVMRSFFGGLLCVAWSPDGKYLCTGGEDDLVSIWSFVERRVAIRCQGHRSYVSSVAFDHVMSSCADASTTSSSPLSISVHRRRSQRQLSRHNTDNSVAGKSSPAVENGKMSSEESDVGASVARSVATLHAIAAAHSLPNRRPLSANTSALLSVASEIQPDCYRIASVGHDTQLILWELFADQLQPPLRSRASVAGLATGGSSDGVTLQFMSAVNLGGGSGKEARERGGNSGQSRSSAVDCQASSVYSAIADSGVGSGLTALSDLSDTNALHAHSTASAFDRHNGPASAQTSGASIADASSSSSSRKLFSFKRRPAPSQTISDPSVASTVGAGSAKSSQMRSSASGSLRRHRKDIPLSGSSALMDKSASLKSNHIQPLFNNKSNEYGTPVCPRLSELVMSGPFVCKRISYDRLSDLIFLDRHLLIACQDGSVQIWSRPLSKTAPLSQCYDDDIAATSMNEDVQGTKEIELTDRQDVLSPSTVISSASCGAAQSSRVQAQPFVSPGATATAAAASSSASCTPQRSTAVRSGVSAAAPATSVASSAMVGQISQSSLHSPTVVAAAPSYAVSRSSIVASSSVAPLPFHPANSHTDPVSATPGGSKLLPSSSSYNQLIQQQRLIASTHHPGNGITDSDAYSNEQTTSMTTAYGIRRTVKPPSSVNTAGSNYTTVASGNSNTASSVAAGFVRNPGTVV